MNKWTFQAFNNWWHQTILDTLLSVDVGSVTEEISPLAPRVKEKRQWWILPCLCNMWLVLFFYSFLSFLFLNNGLKSKTTTSKHSKILLLNWKCLWSCTQQLRCELSIFMLFVFIQNLWIEMQMTERVPAQMVKHYGKWKGKLAFVLSNFPLLKELPR